MTRVTLESAVEVGCAVRSSWVCDIRYRGGVAVSSLGRRSKFSTVALLFGAWVALDARGGWFNEQSSCYRLVSSAETTVFVPLPMSPW